MKQTSTNKAKKVEMTDKFSKARHKKNTPKIDREKKPVHKSPPLREPKKVLGHAPRGRKKY